MLYCFPWLYSVYLCSSVVKRLVPSPPKSSSTMRRAEPLVGTDLPGPGVLAPFASNQPDVNLSAVAFSVSGYDSGLY